MVPLCSNSYDLLRSDTPKSVPDGWNSKLIVRFRCCKLSFDTAIQRILEKVDLVIFVQFHVLKGRPDFFQFAIVRYCQILNQSARMAIAHTFETRGSRQAGTQSP